MRTLLDCAVQAAQAHAGPTQRFTLVGVEAASLGATGARSYVQASIAAGRTHTSARELADTGTSLQTLALALLSEEQQLDHMWLIDGWRLLRLHGTAVDLQGARLRGAQLQGAHLAGADLREADLAGADLEKADLSGSNLTGANLAGSILARANLRAADLTEAELCRTDLRHSDLRESRCTRAAFRGADLWEAVISDLDLSQAFVDGAELDRVGRFSDQH
ncbi:pentapeptide repeat-containing protein [Kitasatospora sp. NPDC004669]|uniref:pentapeptide repeat-containing protein n=1 Tax=Kitasatospora sp. NPDC004669 TaxID=3154555 RepID=UPI00339E3653